VIGSIFIDLNCEKKIINAHNPSTHDDCDKLVSYHRIMVYIDQQVWKTVDKIRSEEELLGHAERLRGELKVEMSNRANTIPAKTFQERLNDILNS
jgi:hypothetical protein